MDAERPGSPALHRQHCGGRSAGGGSKIKSALTSNITAVDCARFATPWLTYISRPALAGRFYQVKARTPDGHKVKLYIDAYSGRIVKVKG